MNIKQSAFTLIELLVVIAIIGILSGLIVVSMNGVTEKASIAKTQAFSNSLRNAILLSMAAEWKFDEGTGTSATDSWKYIATGTITGATYAVADNCLYGRCLNFTGSGQYVTVAHTNVPVFTNKMTAMAWVKGVSQTNRAIIGQLDTNAQRSWAVYSGTNGKLRVVLSADGGATNSKDYISTASIGGFDGKWHLVGFTFSAGTLSLYVDGQATTVTKTVDGTCASLYDSTAALTMGCDLASGTQSNLYTGLLDDTRIYSETIPTAQIKEMYYSGLNRLLEMGEITEDEYVARIAE